MSEQAKPATSGAGPLAGIRVLDLSRVLAGPYCTMLLGDLGAEVIKIERPGTGDDTRHWGPPFKAGESAYFLSCNRNKKSVTLNLKDSRGQQLIRDMVEHADVLLENYLPGKLESYGLGYEDLRKVNSGLIYCSISGFGQTGPRCREPGYDLLIQAASGVMSITGEPGRQPMKVGVAIADITAGLFASNAIMAALVKKATSGQGEYIDIALYDACLAWLANVGSSFLMTGELPERLGNAHPSIVPYQAFAAADASFVVAVGNDDQFTRFCDAIGRPELASDGRFLKNPDRVCHRAALIKILAAHFQTDSSEQWLQCLSAAGVPSGPINTLDAAFSDPQVIARHSIIQADHPICEQVSMVASPMRLASMSEGDASSAPPMLGEHTSEVLSRLLGLSDAQQSVLSRAGVI